MFSENPLALRIVEFLKSYPPFSFLENNELLHLAESASIEHHESNQILFRENQEPLGKVFLIRKGSVKLSKISDGQKKLVDMAEEGEMFGLRAMLSKKPYLVEAECAEECLLYCFPVMAFEQVVNQYAPVANYLAVGLAAGMPIIRPSIEAMNQVKTDLQSLSSEPSFMLGLEGVEVDRSKKVITGNQNDTLAQLTLNMVEEKVGSIVIVDENDHPKGIITDSDIRFAMAKHPKPNQLKGKEIMTSPVICVGQNLTWFELNLSMIQSGVRHLVVTEDGSPMSPVRAVISEYDLLHSRGDHAASIIREIRKSQRIDEIINLREKAEKLIIRYLSNDLNMDLLGKLVTEINDACIRSSIKFAINDMASQENGFSEPPCSFCWLSLGSEARMEQFLRTDQDNAIVYAKAAKEDEEKVKGYFLGLASLVNEYLNQAGFAYCPSEVMARNPKWCLDLDSWKTLFKKWIEHPNAQSITHCTIFFDYRPVYGTFNLADELSTFIFSLLAKSDLFMSLLAKDALGNPAPLGIFRGFVLEKSGENKEKFDIKSRALMPIIDAARVLTFHYRLKGTNNTLNRLKKIADNDPANAHLYREASQAFKIFLKQRALSGFSHKNTGRFLDLNELSKLELNILKKAFKPIDELQELLEVRFQIHYLR